jgi:hypothetical protein
MARPANELTTVSLEEIDSNPNSDTHLAPLDQERIADLVDYHKAHQMWPLVPIGRRVGNRLQLAWGQHIIEAAKLLGLQSIELKIANLSDDDMINLMPTWHGPHVKPDFLVCLLAWQKALARNSAQAPTELARRFGWVRDDPRRPEQPRMNDTATACQLANEVISAGKAENHDFSGMTIGRAIAHARYIKVRKGHMGFFYFAPDEQLGIRKRTVIDKDEPLHSMGRPLHYTQNPEIGVLVKNVDGLVMMIDRLLHDSPVADEAGSHLKDFVVSLERKLTDRSPETVAQIEKVMEALDAVVARAAHWHDRLDKAERRAPSRPADSKPRPVKQRRDDPRPKKPP